MKKLILLAGAIAFCTNVLAQKKDPLFIQFTSEDQAMIADLSGAISLVDLSSGAVASSYPTETDPKAKMWQFGLTQDRKTAFAIFRNKNLWIWEVAGGKVIATIPKVLDAEACDHYIVYLHDGKVSRYDLATSAEETLKGSSFIVPESQSRLFVAEGNNLIVYVQGTEPRAITLPEKDRMDISRDGRYIATATSLKSGDFKWTMISADDGSTVYEKEEKLGPTAEKFNYFGFSWQGNLMYSTEKTFAVPGDLPKVTTFIRESKEFKTDEMIPGDSEPKSWGRTGVVILGSNVSGPGNSWSIAKDPNEKYTPASGAAISPDGSKLVVMRKKSASLELYDLKDKEAITTKAMGMSFESQKPKLLKAFPLP